MLIQENHKDNVSFERVQRTLYQLSKRITVGWQGRSVYRRLLKLTRNFVQMNSPSFTMYNGSYIGANGGVLELSFRVPADFDGFDANDVLFIAESMSEFIHVFDRFNGSGLPGGIEFENCEIYSLDLAVVIPVDFVENYNN